MIRAALTLLSAVVVFGAEAMPVVVDFEAAALFAKDDLASRIERWEEKGVVFKLARSPQRSKAKGLVMFFPNVDTGRKGILSAMANESIPVQATFPAPVSSVAISFWGSTATPALLEAFDAEGKLVDRASLASAPLRKSPGDPVPTFTMTVNGPRIAYIQFSGPREGEYLVADEVRFTPGD